MEIVGEFKRSYSDISCRNKGHSLLYVKVANKRYNRFSEVLSMDLGNSVCTVIRTDFTYIFSIRFIFGGMNDLKTFLQRVCPHQEE